MSGTAHIISTFFTKSGKSVRKDYLRCHLLRHLKKLIRMILKGHTLFSFFPEPWQLPTSQAMQRTVIMHQELFTDLSQIRKRIEGVKSFNDRYCRGLLESREMRNCYSLYIELVLGEGEGNPAELCKRLKHYCCRDERHGEECREKWKGLREYLKIGLIRELGLD